MKKAQCGECPYRGIDGGPGPVMVCEYPGAVDYGYIIRWEHGRQISDRCPLPDAPEGVDGSNNEEETHA